MRQIVDDTTSAGLLPALETNMAAFYAAYGHAPGCVVHAASDAVWFYSGIPDPLFNGVLSTRLTAAGVAETVAQLNTQIAARGAPALWWIGPRAQPEQIGALLEQHGLQLVGEVPGMAIDLGAIDSALDLPPELTIQAASGADMPALWARTAGLGSGLPADALEALEHLETTIDDTSRRRYLGFVEGQPIATSALVLAAGVAGIYAVATLPAARRRGIGRLMTLLPLLEARRQGYRVGVLQASTMGYPLYEQIGFREVCRYQLYLQSA
jgi:ribosomal protein S18 acetylase RimI-like enzyme